MLPSSVALLAAISFPFRAAGASTLQIPTGTNWQFGLTGNGLFLGLAVTQAAHSIEEHFFRLYEVLAITRYVVGLISSNLALGFAIANTLVVVFIFWTYFRRVRPVASSATAWIWGWALLEFANGSGHIILAADADGYFPGLFTAPFLLLISLALMYRLVHPVRQTPAQ